ncbi:MAG TPA: hypothetical protein VGZ90_13420 [Puia sp.]|jgi:hypothetical protein|nr:hypothetical protein [Puia sp.]
MIPDELIVKLAHKIGDRFIVETSWHSFSIQNGECFKTVIKYRDSEKLLYECVTPKMVGTNTYERSKELHFETVLIELMANKL